MGMKWYEIALTKKKSNCLPTSFQILDILFLRVWKLAMFWIVDLKKHTAEDNPDKIILERAIESLKEVMT